MTAFTVTVTDTPGATASKPLTLTVVTPPPEPPPVKECHRKAWLVLGARTLPLEDLDAGYLCSELTLGYPTVRDVTNNRPDRDGIDDRTKLWGERAISADIRALGGTMTVDEIGSLFGPFMLPNARPELHYVLDRDDYPERFTTVRAADYAWAISGSKTRDIHLAWVASDPIMRGATQRSAVAMAGASVVGGRTYNLTFDRSYPPGGGSPTTGIIQSSGDVPVRPLLRIWGPVTNPVVTLTPSAGATPSGPAAVIRFVAGFSIDAGDWVDVDTNAKTVFRNDGTSAMAQLDWSATVWPLLPTSPYWSWLTIRGDSTTSTTQVEALWYDGYLT